MRYAKILFDSEAATITAYYEMAKRAKVISLTHDQFIVPEPAVGWLKEHGLKPQVRKWMSQDEVVRTLRNTLIPPNPSYDIRGAPPPSS